MLVIVAARYDQTSSRRRWPIFSRVGGRCDQKTKRSSCVFVARTRGRARARLHSSNEHNERNESNGDVDDTLGTSNATFGRRIVVRASSCARVVTRRRHRVNERRCRPHPFFASSKFARSLATTFFFSSLSCRGMSREFCTRGGRLGASPLHNRVVGARCRLNARAPHSHKQSMRRGARRETSEIVLQHARSLANGTRVTADGAATAI